MFTHGNSYICYSSQNVCFPADLKRIEEKGGKCDRKGSGGWGKKA